MSTVEMSAATSTRAEKRLNVRLSADALAIIKEAAEVQQQDMTSFVLGAALERARGVLLEDRILRLSPVEVNQLEAALDRDPQVIPQLESLIRRVNGRRAAPELSEC